MKRVLINPYQLYEGDWPCVQIFKEAGFSVVYPKSQDELSEPAALIAYLQGCSAVMASVEVYDEQVFAATQLKAIARVGVGFDSIDIPAATRHGVAVTITPGTNHESVAEQAVGMMLAVSRQFALRDQQVRAGIWDRALFPRLAGKTLGLVGLGRIGKSVVPKAKGLGLEIIAYDPFPDDLFAAEHGIHYVSLEELFHTADVVSLHLPATKETHHLINETTLKMMKPEAILINTSRGNLVDEHALVKSLESGHLFGVGLDVFEQEPLRFDHRLREFEHVLLLPHVAGLDAQSMTDMTNLAAQCIVDLSRGEWPEHCVVNREVQSSWVW